MVFCYTYRTTGNPEMPRPWIAPKLDRYLSWSVLQLITPYFAGAQLETIVVATLKEPLGGFWQPGHWGL